MTSREDMQEIERLIDAYGECAFIDGRKELIHTHVDRLASRTALLSAIASLALPPDTTAEPVAWQYQEFDAPKQRWFSFWEPCLEEDAQRMSQRPEKYRVRPLYTTPQAPKEDSTSVFDIVTWLKSPDGMRTMDASIAASRESVARLELARQFKDAVEQRHDAPKEPVAVPAGWKLVPIEPTPELLASMGMRYRHDFGLMNDVTKESVIRTMRQLHEEVVGTGFHKAAPPVPMEDAKAIGDCRAWWNRRHIKAAQSARLTKTDAEKLVSRYVLAYVWESAANEVGRATVEMRAKTAVAHKALIDSLTGERKC